jgi:hypothetical protein
MYVFLKVEWDNGSEYLKRDFGSRVQLTSRAVLCSTAGDGEKEANQYLSRDRMPRDKDAILRIEVRP